MAMTGGNASNSSNSSVPGSPDYLQWTMFICDSILMPPICCLGIVGNVLSLCVLTRKQMTGAATCFLTAMAVSDLVLLVFQLPTLLWPQNNPRSSDTSKVFFRGYYIPQYVMTNVFLTCTCWLTVAVAFERLVSLRFTFPFIHREHAISRARATTVVIFVLSFIFHFSKFFEYVPNPDLSSPKPLLATNLARTPVYEIYLHITNIALTAIIPMILLIVVNTFLIHFLATYRRRMQLQRASISSNFAPVDVLQISAAVVATILAFIVCLSPGVFLALTIASRGRHWVFSQPVYTALKHIANLLVSVNSSINFLLYCTISSKFRKTFIAMFSPCLTTKGKQCSTFITMSSHSSQ